MRRLTFEFVRDEFRKAGCTLLATSYSRNSEKLPYICKCGRRSQITWNKFKEGQRCYDCRNRKIGDCKRTDYEDVVAYYYDQQCTLLADKYHDCDTPMPFICVCGREGITTFYNFKHLGVRCLACAHEKTGDAYRYTLEQVKEFFLDQGCVLLADKYVNAFTVMPYLCHCGRYAEIIWNSFQRGNRCKACGIEKIANDRKFSYEYVKMYFEGRGCTLLSSEYVNSQTPLEYRCACGEIAKVTFNRFTSQGSLCWSCRDRRAWQVRRENEKLWNESNLDADLDRLLTERCRGEQASLLNNALKEK